jgi:hypothetical protein
MSKYKFLAFLLLIQSFMAAAQEKPTKKTTQLIPPPNLITAGISLPIGRFSSSHTIGFAIDYYRSRNHFGAAAGEVIKLSYLLNGGANYFLGKKEKITNTTTYTYPAFTSLYATGGILYVPIERSSVGFTLGPAINFYNKTSRFAIASKLEVNYFISNAAGISISMMMNKETKADPFWSASAKFIYAF